MSRPLGRNYWLSVIGHSLAKWFLRWPCFQVFPQAGHIHVKIKCVCPQNLPCLGSLALGESAGGLRLLRSGLPAMWMMPVPYTLHWLTAVSPARQMSTAFPLSVLVHAVTSFKFLLLICPELCGHVPQNRCNRHRNNMIIWVVVLLSEKPSNVSQSFTKILISDYWNPNNTPTEGLELSPAQRPFGRRTKNHHVYYIQQPATFVWQRSSKRTPRKQTGKGGKNAWDTTGVTSVLWPSVNLCICNPSHLINASGGKRLLPDSHQTEHTKSQHLQAEHWDEIDMSDNRCGQHRNWQLM